jgi:hypothetical protein
MRRAVLLLVLISSILAAMEDSQVFAARLGGLDAPAAAAALRERLAQSGQVQTASLLQVARRLRRADEEAAPRQANGRPVYCDN